jgi:hypothetical protein
MRNHSPRPVAKILPLPLIPGGKRSMTIAASIPIVDLHGVTRHVRVAHVPPATEGKES